MRIYLHAETKEDSCYFYLMTNLTHNSFLCMFISILYMFRAFKCSSLRDSIVSIQYLGYVTLTVWYAGLDGTSKPAYQTVTYIE